MAASASRLALAESELALAESRNAELGALVTKAQEEQQTMSRVHQTELRREREVSSARREEC